MNLQALEAGVLRGAETAVWGAFVAGLQAALPLLNSSNLAAVDWNSVAHTFLAAVLVALLAGVRSYHAAVGSGVGSAPADSAPAAPDAGAAPTPAEPSAGQ